MIFWDLVYLDYVIFNHFLFDFLLVIVCFPDKMMIVGVFEPPLIWRYFGEILVGDLIWNREKIEKVSK